MTARPGALDNGPARRLRGGRLVIASHNPGKVVEFADLLAPFGAELVSAGELGLAEPEETGASFAANAEIKANAAATAAKLPALAALFAYVPASQVLLGTDYPFGATADTIRGLEEFGLDAGDLDSIYRGNAERLIPRLRSRAPVA